MPRRPGGDGRVATGLLPSTVGVLLLGDSLSALVLWTVAIPAAAGFGVAAGLVTYVALRPREKRGWSELLGEAWRLVALAAAVPGFLLGAEIALWGWLLDFRAPLAHTGIGMWIGLLLLAAGAIPIASGFAYRGRLSARAAALGGGLALAGAVAIVSVAGMRESSLSALLERAAAGDDQAVERVLSLKAYRYVDIEQASAALDRALPDGGSLVKWVRPDAAPPIAQDAELREFFAARLERALADDPGGVGEAVVSDIWRLTDDPARTIRGYAGLRGLMAEEGGSLYQPAVRDALERAERAIALTVVEASYGPLAAEALSTATISALTEHQWSDPPIGELATLMLLRDASTEALRPVVARFADDSAPEWRLLLRECPRRTQGLERLAKAGEGSGQPADATAGASALLAYVRQYCSDWYSPG